jgi:hypothetical protein
MAALSCRLDSESKTVYRITGNGSYFQQPDSGNPVFLPNEIWLEKTTAYQIGRNAKLCLTYRTNSGKGLLTGLRITSEPRWFRGNFLRYEAGKRAKIQLVIFISQDKETIEIYRPSGRAKKTTDKEKSLPEVFKGSRMKYHPDTRQR